MFKNFLTALLEKITTYLIKHPDFFKSEIAKRKENLDHLSIPVTFKKYLEEVKENDFLKDLSAILIFIHNPKNAGVQNNSFFIALIEFFNTELARKIDNLDSEFYLLPKKKRKEFMEGLIPSDSNLAKSLRAILEDFTYQQLASEINNLGQKVKDSAYIVIQSPREIDPKLKREIRTRLTEENPLSFPSFQINKKLIGGLRIFNNGKTIDHSWLSRVLRFTSLTSA